MLKCLYNAGLIGAYSDTDQSDNNRDGLPVKHEFQTSPFGYLFYGILSMWVKLTVFQSFTPEAVAATVKVQNFAPSAFAVNKHLQILGK